MKDMCKYGVVIVLLLAGYEPIMCLAAFVLGLWLFQQVKRGVARGGW